MLIYQQAADVLMRDDQLADEEFVLRPLLRGLGAAGFRLDYDGAKVRGFVVGNNCISGGRFCFLYRGLVPVKILFYISVQEFPRSFCQKAPNKVVVSVEAN